VIRSVLKRQLARYGALALGFGLSAQPLSPQSAIGRALRPPNAHLGAEFFRIVGVRELRDGRVLVADAGDRRVVVVEFERNTITAISREGRGPGEYASIAPLYALGGDSTLMSDPANGRWLLFHTDRVARTVAPDDPAVRASQGGVRGADERGIAIVTTPPGLRGGTQLFGKEDSNAVLQVTRASGTIDTIARLRMAPLILQSELDKSGRPTSLSVVNPPLAAGEEPILFPDGWVAVARLGPYRIDWRSADGRWIRGGPLPFVEQPVDAREREAYLARRARSSGTQPAAPADDSWPKTIPPFLSRPLLPAPDGTLLILRTPTADHPGNRYDQVDRSGRLVAWVELPAAERLAGIGARSAYVIVTDEDGLQHLKRHPWP